MFCFFFFFKQKTAYEMRISDWSSDVCSSDLPWNCATKRVVLSPDAAAPAFGYANRFQMPGDWLRTLAVTLDRYARPDYKREGNFYLCDADALQLRYTWNNENPGPYDASLVGALAAAMSEVLAYPVTKRSE